VKIEVKSTAVTNKSGTSKANKPYSINEQEAWIDMANGERRKVKVSLEDGAKPYTPGFYELDDESFFVNQFGGLEIGRIRLVAARAARAA
jgi:hypothetical protein